jgi:hypothetical protein
MVGGSIPLEPRTGSPENQQSLFTSCPLDYSPERSALLSPTRCLRAPLSPSERSASPFLRLLARGCTPVCRVRRLCACRRLPVDRSALPRHPTLSYRHPIVSLLCMWIVFTLASILPPSAPTSAPPASPAPHAPPAPPGSLSLRPYTACQPCPRGCHLLPLKSCPVLYGEARICSRRAVVLSSHISAQGPDVHATHLHMTLIAQFSRALFTSPTLAGQLHPVLVLRRRLPLSFATSTPSLICS